MIRINVPQQVAPSNKQEVVDQADGHDNGAFITEASSESTLITKMVISNHDTSKIKGDTNEDICSNSSYCSTSNDNQEHESKLEKIDSVIYSIMMNERDISKKKQPYCMMENTLNKNASKINDGFVISWHNLSYTIEPKWSSTKQEGKRILNNLSGSFKSGELAAVLGPSGAGKSTLISCLLGKKRDGVTGSTELSFNINNIREEKNKQPLKIAIIPQKDQLLDTLTVTEALMFASRFKNAHLNGKNSIEDNHLKGNKTDRAIWGDPFDHMANVQQVLKQLNLESCANIRCGKISGGQYKRVSIGLELLSRPQLMILDEPTSGLDSITSLKTIRTLRQLVDSSSGYSMSIVTIIHQPDNELFNLFHKAYVLAAGGRAIYEGKPDGILKAVEVGIDQAETVNNNQQLIDLKNQLKSANGSNQLSTINLARLIVEVAAGEFGSEIVDSMSGVETTVLNYPKSIDYLSSYDATNINGSKSGVHLLSITTAKGRVQTPDAYRYKNNSLEENCSLDKRLNARNVTNYNGSLRVYLKHVRLQVKRCWLSVIREPMLCTLQLSAQALISLLICYTFINHENSDACLPVKPIDFVEEAYGTEDQVLRVSNELQEVFATFGYILFQTITIILLAMCTTALTYPLVMHVLLREYQNGWYSISSYYFGKSIADIPILTTGVILAMSISYHLTGQPASPYYWRFLFILILTIIMAQIAQSVGLIFGALFMHDPQSATFISAASIAPLIAVGGFLIRTETLPLPLQILSKLSYLTHYMKAFLILRYGFNICPCDNEQFAIDGDHKIPQSINGLVNIWIDTFASEYQSTMITSNSTENVTTNIDAEPKQQIDLIGKLTNSLSQARTFGYEIKSCQDYKSWVMLDYKLNDHDIMESVLALIIIWFVFKIMAFFILKWKVNRSV